MYHSLYHFRYDLFFVCVCEFGNETCPNSACGTFLTKKKKKIFNNSNPIIVYTRERGKMGMVQQWLCLYGLLMMGCAVVNGAFVVEGGRCSRSSSSSSSSLDASRRSLVVDTMRWGVVVATAGSTAAFAAGEQDEDDDPLDAFGKQLSESKWPDSPSPLPTSFRSAAELTAPREEDDDNTTTTDLEKALAESSKKKRIDPLTHAAYDR